MTNSANSYFKNLESKSIYIVREVASEFKNPVTLYSVGKDSGVMVRLAQKAFCPGNIHFPLLHVDAAHIPHYLKSHFTKLETF